MVRRTPVERFAVLDGKRIYILPTKQGMLFALMLFLMLTGSINYDLSLGFALTFLLSGLYLVSIYHAFANLAGLRLEPGKLSPVFAGEAAIFKMNVAAGEKARQGIGFLARGNESFRDVAKGKDAVGEFIFMTKRRGWLRPGRFTVFTLYPLGLFRAWSYVELDMPCLVYPRPASDFPGRRGGDSEKGPIAISSHDDFSGLRAYRPGDSFKHVAWKNFSTGRPLQVKEFEETKGEESLWLDYGSIQGDVEERLSKLVAMTLDAHKGGVRFGLRLPDKTIQPGMGVLQKLQVLEALALFET